MGGKGRESVLGTTAERGCCRHGQQREAPLSLDAALRPPARALGHPPEPWGSSTMLINQRKSQRRREKEENPSLGTESQQRGTAKRSVVENEPDVQRAKKADKETLQRTEKKRRPHIPSSLPRAAYAHRQQLRGDTPALVGGALGHFSQVQAERQVIHHLDGEDTAVVTVLLLRAPRVVARLLPLSFALVLRLISQPALDARVTHRVAFAQRVIHVDDGGARLDHHQDPVGVHDVDGDEDLGTGEHVHLLGPSPDHVLRVLAHVPQPVDEEGVEKVKLGGVGVGGHGRLVALL